jgi:mycofactocin biosynthesis protein MftB
VVRDTVMLERRLALDPQVALRPEPFGALAYHYGNRRLIFLKHPDVVRVVRALGEHESVAETLTACGIAETRWPMFVTALESLERSQLVRDAA